MAKQIKRKELLELKTDIQLLIECLDINKEDISASKQALMTLASILQGSADAKEVFCETGGLQKVLELVTNNRCDEVVEAGLYCLGSGVERNVYGQKLLTTASMFTLLHGILSSGSRSSVRKKQTASFLVLCLVSNNGSGQNLVRQSSCLHDILTLIRTTMPDNVQDLDSDWFVGMEGKSLTLWCTLLSTACACVNNPLNEGNQRICASLLPYLFSVLTNQRDERVLRPVLSLIGLTVSGNLTNQDRVRMCGGLEIFVSKADSLKQTAATDSSAKAVTVQLLSTVDACLSDNEKNSKMFGKLGGIKLVLGLLSECCFDISEKIQAVLTLAHALDAYIGNKKYIEEDGGITVLLQQLTVTQDEEFSKTIKYLLHMVVSTDKSSLDEELNLNDTERLISKMESMKRYSDKEMLKKIRELDSKLKCMEEKHQQLESSHSDKHSPNVVYQRSEHDRTDSYSLQNFDVTGSLIGSHTSKSLQQDCPTPREKTLMEQLIKERSEKERLEKLNHMLQENICKTHTSFVRHANNELAAQNSGHASTPEPNVILDKLVELQLRNKNSNSSSTQHDLSDFYGNKLKMMENNDRMSAPHQTECNGRVMTNSLGPVIDNVCQSVHTVQSSSLNSEPIASVRITRSGQKYPTNSTHNVYNYPLQQAFCPTNTDHLENKTVQVKGFELPFSNEYTTGVSICSTSARTLSNNTGVFQLNHDTLKPYVAVPVDMASDTKAVPNTLERVTTVNLTDTISQGGGICNEEEKRPISDRKSDVLYKHPKKKTIINKNAEIQCGTPFITAIEAKAQRDKGNNRCVFNVNENGSQTELSRISASHELGSEGLSFSSNSKRTLKVNDENNEEMRIQKNTKNVQSVDNIYKNFFCKDLKKIDTDSIEDKDNKIRNQPMTVPKGSPVSKGFFLKPVALPPKKKIRVTPQLGSDKLSGLRNIKTRDCPSIDESGNDIQSEFDLNLLKTMRKKSSQIPAAVVKSQNNVKEIDRLVKKQDNNRAENWQVHPSTPVRQSIVPPRPAYSDCGTRRCVLGNHYSIESQGSRRRSLDDSGIHSPQNILSISRQNSPVDSNIDGFRSSSDISDEEEGPPNISAAVLRSSKKINKKTENKCPGCTGVSSSGREGLELNSRTYNIALETDPNTCQMHRKLRQLERIYIHKLRKSKGLNSRLKRKLKGKNSDLKTKDVYEFCCESTDNISPVSDENLDVFHPPIKTKKRRKRVPYTEEEEENLMEGVRVLGKNWNQILNTYSFHSSRTNVDLKDKYKRIVASNGQACSSRCLSGRSRTLKPFSMCEERRLRRGIMKHGYNWKTILRNFTFAQGRTTEDLRNKWRTLHKKDLNST